MVAGFSVLSLALDAQTDIVTTQRIVSDIEIKKQQEQFGVSASTDANDLLSVNINNLSQNPVEISSMWITNKTLSDQPATRYTINYDDAFIPSGFTSNVVSGQSLAMIPDTYDIKVISALGSIKTVELVVGAGASTSGLRAELITDPPDVIIGQNVTIAMIVTNTGEGIIQNVEPDLLSVGGAGSIIASTPHTPLSVNLDRGESVMFSWDYQVTGDSGDDLTFSAIARGDAITPDDVWTNVVSDTSILREPTDGGTSTTELIVLTQDLLARPEMFVIVPGPFGDDGQKALWGVNIVNPTAQDLFVSKVVVAVSTSQPTGSDIIINSGSCGATAIPGTPIGTWSCPADNQVMWKNLSTPAQVPGFSSVPFLVKINPGSISGGPDASLETIPVTATVFTTLGQFGKSGYATSLDNGGAPLANVYLTDNPGSTADGDILTTVSGISSGSTVKLNATLADFDTGTTQFIDKDVSRLIINIPKGWTNPNVLNAPGFNVVTPIQTFADGSSQIVGFLISDLTGAGGVAQTIEFEVTAPTVTSTQLYVMYVLADGTTKLGDNALGPLSEVLLQVVPP